MDTARLLQKRKMNIIYHGNFGVKSKNYALLCGTPNVFFELKDQLICFIGT